MIIETKYNIGDEVRPGVTVHRVLVRYDTQFFEKPDIHYVLSDGYYKSEEEISSSEIGK